MEDSVWALAVPFLLSVIALRLWARFVEQTADSSCSLPLPPGGVGLPFLGETAELAWRGYAFFRHRRSVYGRVYRTHLMGRPTVQVFGSENIQKILKSEEVGVSMQWPHSVRMLIGQGSLMASSGEIHHIRRQCVLAAFTEGSINGLYPSMQSTIRKHLLKWMTQGTILGQKESRYLATDVAAQCLLGYSYSQREIYQISDALEIIEKGFFSFPYQIPGSSLYKGMESRQLILKLIDKAIEHHRQDAASTGVLAALVNSEEVDRLNLDEIQDVSLEMLFCTVEGISSALCTMLLELARHQHCAERACQELFHLDLIETQRDGDITVSKMADLRYIKRVVKELLRLTPPMGGGYRQVLRTMEVDGYQIPRGWTVHYSIRDQHETVLSNSEQFDPDRWLPERDVSKIDKHLYMPFGGPGRRSCVGRYPLDM